MTEPRRIALVTSYDELIAALRARADELKITRETLDAVSGLQSGYSGKLLAPVPIRQFGRTSLGPMLQAMGLAIVLIEDVESLRRFSGQHALRKKPALLADGKNEIVTIQVSRRKLRRLAAKGGRNRASKLTARQRHRIAKKAIKTRWLRKRARRSAVPKKPVLIPIADTQASG